MEQYVLGIANRNPQHRIAYGQRREAVRLDTYGETRQAPVKRCQQAVWTSLTSGPVERDCIRRAGQHRYKGPSGGRSCHVDIREHWV
eukprot:scaffold225_cov388-Prasinococcus_capsulatus_cf.AAC.19